jgi:hypothetical protein
MARPVELEDNAIVVSSVEYNLTEKSIQMEVNGAQRLCWNPPNWILTNKTKYFMARDAPLKVDGAQHLCLT